jgi:hypothetical protein
LIFAFSYRRAFGDDEGGPPAINDPLRGRIARFLLDALVTLRTGTKSEREA